MKLSRLATAIILFALFLAGVSARVATTDPRDSPYYKGASAMTYRHALACADGASLLAPDAKAAHPDGYVPARYRAAGVEAMAGTAYRVARFFSDIDGRAFMRRLTMLVAALCVFTAYATARRLWDSRAAGFLAAFLTAFLPPLAEATSGRTFSHTVYASFFLSIHSALALRALLTRSRTAAAGAAAAALVLLSAWEAAGAVLAVWIASAALSRSLDRTTRAVFVSAHAGAIVVAGAVFPHLIATRALGSWTTAVALGAVAAAFLPEQGRARTTAFFVAITALLTLAATPWRAGAGEQFPALAYVLTRLRYAFGRPESSLLSDWMRHLWSLDHAPLPAHQMIATLVPIGLCAAALAVNRGARALGARFAVGAAVGACALIAVALDRSALPVAAVAAIVVAAGGARALAAARWTRGSLVTAGAYSAFAGVVFAGSLADPAYQLADAAGVAQRDPHGFVWVSLENTDRELVRFVSTRTSVQESILAPEDLSALLLSFTGRTSVQLCGTTSSAPARRHVDLTRALYRDEAALYQLCREMDIDYVIYSIDVLLDASGYSPRYLAGVSAFDPRSIAVRMHFEPESIGHFTLVYENDHYRLFKVTDSAQPVFLTDHPLFYQADVFERAGRDVEAFRERVVYVMITCAKGIDARARGDAAEARRRLSFCVAQAPRFTQARLALAEVYMDMNRYEDARQQVAAVIAYAPDNPTALYDAAFIEAQLGRPEQAKAYLHLLMTQTGDPAVIERGRALQSSLEQGLPLRPGAPRF